MIYANVPQIIFKNNQNISWNEVEQYLKKYIGKSFVVKEYGDVIYIAGEFPDDLRNRNIRKNFEADL